MTINFANRRIELTKAEATKAKKYGSDEYLNLQNARKENKGFTVVVITRKSSKNSRITLEDMRRYISFHDDKNGSIMETFKAKCKGKEDGELHGSNFFAIKKWFFETYPEVA